MYFWDLKDKRAAGPQGAPGEELWQRSHLRLFCPWSLTFCPLAPFLLCPPSILKGQEVTLLAGGFHSSDVAPQENSLSVSIPNSEGPNLNQVTKVPRLVP